MSDIVDLFVDIQTYEPDYYGLIPGTYEIVEDYTIVQYARDLGTNDYYVAALLPYHDIYGVFTSLEDAKYFYKKYVIGV